MVIHREIKLDIVNDSKCENYDDEYEPCVESIQIELTIDGIKSYYCIVCDMDDFKYAIWESV